MGFYKVLLNSILFLTLFGSIFGQQHESHGESFEDPTVGGVAGNPGAKIRFSTKALDAIYDHALLKITEKLKSMKLPESVIPIDGGTLSIKSARITEAKIPNYSRDMAPPNQIHSHLYGAMIKSEGEWHYRPQGGVRSISSGIFRSHVTNAELNATSKFDGTKDGRPMVTVGSCEAHLGQFRVEIEGYGNESKPYVIDKCDNVKCKNMVDFFEGAVCNAARNYVSEYVNKKLATFPTKVNLGKDFVLDYRMMNCDSVADDYIQGDLEGEVVSRSGGSANFHAAQLSPMPMGKPISFSLGDYAFNTLFHQAHQQQFPFSAYDLLANNSALWQSLSLNCSSSPKTRELESSPSTEKSSPSTTKSTPSSSKSTKSTSSSKPSTRRSTTTRSSTVKSTSTSRPSTSKSSTTKSTATSRPSTTKSSTEKSSSTSRSSTTRSSTMKSTSTSRPSTSKSSTMKSSPTSRSSTMKTSTSPRSSPTTRSSTTKLSTTPRSTSTKSTSMRSTSTPKSTSISSSASTSTAQSSTRTGPTRRGFRKQPNVQNKPNKPTSQCLGSIFDNSADGQQFQSNGLGNLVFRSQRPIQVVVNAQSQKSYFSTQGGILEIYEAGDHSEKPRSAKVIFRANVKSLNGVFSPKLNGSNISGSVEVQKLELSQQSNQLRHRSISNDQLSKLSEFAKPILSAMFNSFLEQFAQFPVPLIEGYECSQPGFRWSNRTMQIDCDIRVLSNAIRKGGKDPKKPKSVVVLGK